MVKLVKPFSVLVVLLRGHFAAGAGLRKKPLPDSEELSSSLKAGGADPPLPEGHRHLQVLENEGKGCWAFCGEKGGNCDYCGTGQCCRAVDFRNQVKGCENAENAVGTRCGDYAGEGFPTIMNVGLPCIGFCGGQPGDCPYCGIDGQCCRSFDGERGVPGCELASSGSSIWSSGAASQCGVFKQSEWIQYANYSIAHDGTRGLKDVELSSAQSVEELVEEIGEDVDLDGIHYKKDGLLSKADCEALILHFDSSASARGASPDQHFQAEEIVLSHTEIAGVIGEEAFRGVLAFLFDSLGEVPVTSIVVRRTYADGVRRVGAMRWHAHEKIPGFKEGTVAVALNADDDVEGGALYILTRDGPARAPRSQGRGYAFPYDTAHSVEPYKGVRYSLFVHANLDQASEVRDT